MNKEVHIMHNTTPIPYRYRVLSALKSALSGMGARKSVTRTNR